MSSSTKTTSNHYRTSIKFDSSYENIHSETPLSCYSTNMILYKLLGKSCTSHGNDTEEFG